MNFQPRVAADSIENGNEQEGGFIRSIVEFRIEI